jgi:hypothetical protein
MQLVSLDCILHLKQNSCESHLQNEGVGLNMVCVLGDTFELLLLF